MKQKIIVIIFFLSFSLCFSQTYYLNVNLRDGTKMKYAIDDIQKIDFSGITTIEDTKNIEKIIKSFKLLQNYPNPFNPTTTIEYEIPKPGYVDISVYDLSGRLVKTLLNKSLQKGNYKVVWNGSNQSGQKVSSGFYVYSIKFDNVILSKKMILIK